MRIQGDTIADTPSIRLKKNSAMKGTILAAVQKHDTGTDRRHAR